MTKELLADSEGDMPFGKQFLGLPAWKVLVESFPRTYRRGDASMLHIQYEEEPLISWLEALCSTISLLIPTA